MNKIVDKKLIIDNIKNVYKNRDILYTVERYSINSPSIQFMYLQRIYNVINMLSKNNLFPLEGKKIYEIGCGTGQWLIDFMNWGCLPHDLYGIDLMEERIKSLKLKLPNSNIICGDATTVCFENNFFDVVLQSTVFTSITNYDLKQLLANEMLRVVKTDGSILWYDFSYNNPYNKNVKGVKKNEIISLFPGCEFVFKKITLAPPITRFLVPKSWMIALFCEKLRILNTHYLVVIKKSFHKCCV